MSRVVLALFVVLVLTTQIASAQQSCPATQPGATMPVTYKGGPTVQPVTPCDLMTRLYVYAADSMQGREAGSSDALRATAYIEREVRRLGLVPAGDRGGYFQYLPVTARTLDPAVTRIIAGTSIFYLDQDFTTTPAATRSITAEVIFGGPADSTASLAEQDVKGRFVVLTPSAGPGAQQRRFRGVPPGLASAAGVVFVSPNLSLVRTQYTFADTMQNEGRAAYAAIHPDTSRRGRAGRGPDGFGNADNALIVNVTPATAATLLGKPLDQARRGDVAPTARVTVGVKTERAPTRNVVGIIRGTDPKLRNEYIVIGAHSDHIGVSSSRPIVEHDSLKAYNIVARNEGGDTRGGGAPSAADWARINSIKDSLRRVYPPRLDSISNGADDDGSGTVSLLEIAEAFAKGPRPRRSLIFVWQMGEEKGLWGSQWFTNHPTVPRDSIVADLNLDMVGRGAPSDVTGRDKNDKELTGGSSYVQLVGAGRLSTELGNIAEEVNKTRTTPFVFDYSMDANGHPQNIYCRSDHANYARYGIPVIFFTTGGHADYHQVTDEPQYIRYEHMARVDQLVYDIAMKVGNLDHRVVVDKTKPESPFARCQQ